MSGSDVDFGGLTIICKAVKTGATVPGASASTSNTVAAGSALTLTRDAHLGKTILLDTAAGSTVTLPASTGGGDRYRFVVSVIPTSNSHIVKVANASDAMQGMLLELSDDAANVSKGWPSTAGTSDTITLNRTTTGGTQKGEWVEVEDVAANVWQVFGCIAATGTEASPFSATV